MRYLVVFTVEIEADYDEDPDFPESDIEMKTFQLEAKLCESNPTWRARSSQRLEKVKS